MEYGALDIILIVLAVLIVCFFIALTIYFFIDRKKTEKQLNDLSTKNTLSSDIKDKTEE